MQPPLEEHGEGGTSWENGFGGIAVPVEGVGVTAPPPFPDHELATSAIDDALTVPPPLTFNPSELEDSSIIGQVVATDAPPLTSIVCLSVGSTAVMQGPSGAYPAIAEAATFTVL